MNSKKKVQDKVRGAKLKSEIKKKIEQGRKKIVQAERWIKDEKNQKKIMAKIGQLKKKVKEEEKKAVSYAQENPARALAIATGIGVLAGALLASLRRKK
ncbi:MAG: DUF883 C-terminal domain-containing protein [Elusimicrobia bacterium]|nr:DUF883 C-terminal domain-containing protein [Elusimicrobiota bacterium]